MVAAPVIQSTVHTGNTVVIMVDIGAQSIKVGRASNLTPNERFNQERVGEIGEIKPVEYVPLRYEGSFSLTKFKIIKNSLKQAGIVPTVDNVLTKPALTFTIIDKITSLAITSFVGCVCDDYRETIAANAIIGEDATFFYINRIDYDADGKAITA
jgi:predicted acyltransferase (DUF342 family)